MNATGHARPGDPSAPVTLALCALSLAIGATMRLVPCWNDFWLDEIWSWESAQSLTSAFGVFTEIHHSNNNHLNTLLLLALGDHADWAIYRLPSFAAGVGGVALSGWLASQRGRLESVFATLLAAFCFALIQFSSEARGYALTVFFALAALVALTRFERSGSRASAAAFGVCVVLGFLAHLVFCFFWAGALAQGLLRAWRRSGPDWRPMFALHALPALAFATLWAVDLRQLEVGAGALIDGPLLLARGVGFTLGLPIARGFSPFGALIGISILGIALARLVREGDDAWLLHAVAIVLAPAFVFGVLRPEVIELRYFLIGIALWLLLASFVLADAWRAGGARRAIAGLFVGFFVIGNALHTANFLRDGRGGYSRALQFLAEHTRGRDIVVGGDHDFRNATVLRFYARALPPDKRLVYIPLGSWPAEGPPWLLVHATSRPQDPPPVLELRPTRRFSLAAEFDYAGLSGFWWGLYRNLAAPVDPGPQRAQPP